MALSKKRVNKTVARPKRMPIEKNAASIVRHLERNATKALRKCLRAGMKTLTKDECENIACYCMVTGTFISMFIMKDGTCTPIIHTEILDPEPAHVLALNAERINKSLRSRKDARRRQKD